MKSPGSRKLKEHDVILSCFSLLGRWLFFKKLPLFHSDRRKRNTFRGRGGSPLLGVPLSILTPENFGRNSLHFEEKKRKTIKIDR